MADYSDPVLAKIIALLDASGPAELRGHYVQGDVLAVGASEMPIVAVCKDSTNISANTNMTNKHVMPIVLMVIYDTFNDVGTQDSALQAGLTSLYRLCEGMNIPVSGQYRLNTDSLAYVISNAGQLDDSLWLQVEDDQINTIKYGMGVNRRGPGIFSIEAQMQFTAYLEMPLPKFY